MHRFGEVARPSGGWHGRLALVAKFSARSPARREGRQLWVKCGRRELSFQPPTREQLQRHALGCAIPMVGFGFMDNVVMIQAGDFIDSTLGLALGLSTLTAAAYGQVVSDVCGTLFGNTIDHIAARLGLQTARLTDAQRRMRRVRLAGMAGATIGVICGCLLGMSPPESTGAPATTRSGRSGSAPRASPFGTWRGTGRGGAFGTLGGLVPGLERPGAPAGGRAPPPAGRRCSSKTLARTSG
jgi:hypothetical protein